MEILKSVYTTICCTRLCQVYAAETVKLENSEENIKCDEKIHHDKLEDLPKAIFTTDENLTQPEHLDKVCEEFGENSKTKSSNASTSISENFCTSNARFAEQRKHTQKQSSKKDIEWKMEIIITDNSGYLSNFDEPQRYNALKSISSEIDIQDLLKLPSKAESTRLCVPQSVMTNFTENCKCSTDNMTTSTAYISCQENDKVKKEEKAEAKRNRPFTNIRKRIVTIFRRCFHKNVL